jgi:acyl-CoA reductase-like NAD-dependent aldehyde dehydrogenase
MRALDDGAMLVCGGADKPEGFERGFFFKPTIFAKVAPKSELAQEEVFGPVLAIIPYDTEEEAISIANGTRYGLAGSIWCKDVERSKALARRMRAGQIDVNGGRYNPLAPFGGLGESGYGREMGEFGFEEFLEPISIQS